MLARCLACARPFPRSDELEWFPTGRLVAFDPRRGRLWAVCTACGRWTLAPVEERWEALEELERKVSGGAVLLIETDNVALFRSGGLRLLRVGRTGLREEAWWRYGRVLRGRRLRYAVAAGLGGGAAAAAAGSLVLFMVSLAGALDPRAVRDFLRDTRQRGAHAAAALDRRWRFGAVALRGQFACAACGATLDGIPFSATGRLVLQADGSLRLRCRSCLQVSPRSGFAIAGEQGSRLLRRALAYHNYAGASADELERAVSAVLERDARPGHVAGVVPPGEVLSGLRPTLRLALELAASESAERALLAGEVAALEARWREEEELARIVDDDLTAWPEPHT
jgi:hypothetical protein